MHGNRIDQFNRAQILYNRGDYSGSLTVCNTLLEKWADRKDAPLFVLDHRVATLIKLQKYDDALKDARNMVKIDKTNSSGYLRIGQILQKQKQYKKAMQIYEVGGNSVTDPTAFKVLLEQAVEVRKHIIPEKAKDWLMTALPIEVLEMILDKLEFWEIVRLLSVCRAWKTTLIGMPRLWRNIDAFSSEGRKSVRHKILEAYAERSNWTYTRLNLPPDIALGTLKMLLARSRSLEGLNLRFSPSSQKSKYLPIVMDTKSLKHLDIGQSFWKFAQIVDLIHALPNLVSITAGVDCAPNEFLNRTDGQIPGRMQAVKFRAQPGSRAYHLGNLLDNATGLESLYISGIDDGNIDIRHLSRLKELYLECQKISGLLRFPPDIERISMDCQQESNYQPALHLLENDHLSQLRYLKISKGSTPNLSWELLHECGNRIQELDLSRTSSQSFQYVMDRIRRRKFLALEKLILHCIDVKDEHLADIVPNCPEFRSCQLSNERYVTGSGLRLLVIGARQLKHLALINTPAISLDVIGWARSQGLTVDYRAESEPVSFRRTRGRM